MATISRRIPNPAGAADTTAPKVRESDRRRQYEVAIREVVKQDHEVLEALAVFDRGE